MLMKEGEQFHPCLWSSIYTSFRNTTKHDFVQHLLLVRFTYECQFTKQYISDTDLQSVH